MQNTIHGFRVIGTHDLPDYKGKGTLLEHESGFRVYFINNDDKELFFSYVVYTPPSSSKGISHIIEHTVLAGSRKYPVKDPFMLLVRNSPNTFLNALTGVDRTYYPAASTVRKDFDNIFSVYTDAVFDPLLREETFMQEGIRISGKKPHFEGVVFSEMSGVMSEHESIVASQSVKPLFGFSPYQWESGGDPRAIAELTYEEYIAEHGRFYTPSNMMLFLYGDMDIDDKLRLLDEEYLKDRRRGVPVERAPYAERWKEPRRMTAFSGGSSDTVMLSWLLGDGAVPGESTMLSLIVDILLGSPGCPLYKAITESDLGEDLSSESGMCSSYRELVFSVGFSGAKDAASIERYLLSSLEAIASNGLDSKLVEGAIRKYEFLQKEIKGGTPNGMRLLFAAEKAIMFYSDPAPLLQSTEIVSRIRARWKENPRLFEDWIKKNLLDNPHRLLTRVHGTEDFFPSIEAEIDKVLASKEHDREKEKRFRAFQKMKDSDEAIASVPRLSVSDLPSEIDIIEHEREGCIISAPMTTGGIVYTDILFDVSDFSYEEMDAINLLARLFSMCGAAGMDYAALQTELRYVTGGTAFFVESGSQIDGRERVFFTARMKTLPQFTEEGLSLLEKLFLQPDLDDEKRIRAAIVDIVTEYQANIIQSAHVFAICSSSQTLSPSLYIGERLTGISCWYDLKGKEDIKALSLTLKRVKEKAFTKARMTLHISSEKESERETKRLSESFINRFPEGEKPSRIVHLIPETAPFLGYSAPSKVSFAGVSGAGSFINDREFPSDKMLLSMLSSTVLWQRIREKGGAYGAGISADGIERIWSFYSYRDPRIDGTLDDLMTAFDDFKAEREALDDALIGELSKLVKPLSPSAKALVDLRRTVYGITDEDRAVNLDRTLSLTIGDIERAAERFRTKLQDIRCTVIGDKAALESSKHPFAIKALPL